MKVGDLVQVKNYSSPKNKYCDRLAIVAKTEGAFYEHGCCLIVFADTNEHLNANISNLEVISEGR